jgi:hypothetical protein
LFPQSEQLLASPGDMAAQSWSAWDELFSEMAAADTVE